MRMDTILAQQLKSYLISDIGHYMVKQEILLFNNHMSQKIEKKKELT